LFERPKSGERAVLLHASAAGAPDDAEREEFAELARSAGAELVGELTSGRRTPDPRFFIGRGKVEELKALVTETAAELVISAAPLSPSQERNLERELCCRVLDRGGLILDIFAQRARSFEGKLQVELAQLEHLSTRLVRGWTHLERQKGGIGLRGPGETQLETDRRLLAQRIRQLHDRLENVDKRRWMNRQNRVRAEIPTVALVGYTNAGKSTLFNALTDAGVYVRDKLFATLDPTVRRIELPDGQPLLLTDTVGFVRNLPHRLVQAFKATLEEAVLADFLVHVLDASSPSVAGLHETTREVLRELGADEKRTVTVLNKIDLIEDPAVLHDLRQSFPDAVFLSLRTGTGSEELLHALNDMLRDRVDRVSLRLPQARGDILHRLHREGKVLGESYEGNDILVSAIVPHPVRHVFAPYQVEDDQLAAP